MGREEMETAMVLGDEVILGQTALEKLDLLADCVRQQLMPNPAHPDQSVSKLKQVAADRVHSTGFNAGV
jgi:hypothetical protein